MPESDRGGTSEIAEGGSNEKLRGSTPSVFIIAASQDAEAAQRICEALRATGMEVCQPKRAARRGYLGSVDPQADQDLRALRPRSLAYHARSP